ncbi:unnamed protein product [Rotaria socialis]|uniref:NHL repeat containing protein n=1 Tax=Rotaria socialis TaxID=392032 RepID=A0A821PKT0_9BILA|nr:unnamed protein product [Rotaria socialis]
MHMLFICLFILICADTTCAQVVRQLSGCNAPVCSFPGDSSITCTPCYGFQTANGKNVCAPAVDCSLFDRCINGTSCSSNSTVCVVNTCCLSPVCLPIFLNSTCYTGQISAYSTTIAAASTVPLSQSYSTTLVGGGYSAVNYGSITDIFVDANRNVYASSYANMAIMKFFVGNINPILVGNSMPYMPMAIYVDAAGTIYSCEIRNGLNGSTQGRVQQYVAGNTTGTTLLGGTGCNNTLTSLCGCGGINVDKQGQLYVSDTYNNRVVLFNVSSKVVNYVFGTNAVFGSSPNQLTKPWSISVDANNNVYVFDNFIQSQYATS